MVYPDLLFLGIYHISYRIYPIDYRDYNEKGYQLSRGDGHQLETSSYGEEGMKKQQ
jgi:hypothetical protein